jgi:hypothetical protein
MRDLREDLKERRDEIEARCAEAFRRYTEETKQRDRDFSETVAVLERQKATVNALLAIVDQFESLSSHKAPAAGNLNEDQFIKQFERFENQRR